MRRGRGGCLESVEARRIASSTVWSSLHNLFGRLFMICLVALVRVHRSLEAPQVISMPAQEISVGGRFALGPGRLLHEGRVLLEEGWGYSAGVGGSRSTHNRRSVDPHPRGVGRLEAGRDSADVEPPPGGCGGTRREPETAGQRSGRGRRGRPLGRGCPARQPGPRGVEPVSGSVSTALTLAVPPSRRPAEIVGIPRLCLGSRRRCGVNVSVMDTDAPPGRRERPAPQPAATLKVPTRPTIPAARSSIILASWRRVRQPSGMPLRPYSAPASCP